MTARRIIARVVSWWLSRRVERTAPELAEIKREIETRRRQHRPTRRLVRIQQQLVKARLEAERGKVTKEART